MIVRVAGHTVRLLATCLGILLILLALFSAGARLGLPLLATYKAEVESRVSDYLQNPVNIGSLSVSWEGFGPLLRASQVAVYETEERQVTLDELLIDLDLASSLLRGIPVINELSLVGASLAIEAGKDGVMRVRGMDAVRDRQAAGGVEEKTNRQGVDVIQWLLSARKVGLLDTTVTLIDVQADKQLIVQDLNIRAENAGELHQLRVDLRLPDELGGSLEAGVDLTGVADALSASDGDLYVRADALQMQALSELLVLAGVLDTNDNLLAHIDTAVSVELWGRWENGKPVSARGPVTTTAVVDTDNGQTVMDSLSASLSFVAADGQSHISIKDLDMVSDGQPIRLDKLSLINTSDANADSASWSVTAQAGSLPVSSVATLMQSLLTHSHPSLSESLRQADPRGQVDDLDLAATFEAGDLNLNLNAELLDVRADSFLAVPGMGPVNGRISIEDSFGVVNLTGSAMTMPWTNYSDTTMSVDLFEAEIKLDARDTQRVQLSGTIDLEDTGIETSTRFKATLVPGQSPHLDLQSRFSAADITGFKNWLPRRKMRAGLQRWVDRAIEGGRAENGSLLFFGRLSDFPFDEGDGVFRASVDIVDGRLSFLETWPTSSEINGTLELNGLMLTGSAGPSKLLDFDITQVSTRIDNLLKPVLKLDGTGRGSLQDIINFGNSGPLSRFLKPALTQVTGTGAAEMDLSLSVPLYRPKPAAADVDGAVDVSTTTTRPLPLSVDGAIFLRGNNLVFGRAGMTLESLRGAIGFNERGVRVDNLRAGMLGQPVLVSAETRGLGGNATTQVSINGAMEGNDVLAHYGNPLDQFLRGASSWTVDLLAPHSAERMKTTGLRLNMSSDLVGTELLLPAPLYKSTGRSQAFELSTAFVEGNSSQRWDIRMTDRLQASAMVESGELSSLLVTLGKDGELDDTPDIEHDGIRIQGHAPVLVLDTWAQSISRLIDSLSDGAAGEPQPVLPISTQLRIDDLQLGSRSLGIASLRTNSDDTYLNTVLNNQFIQGSIRYPRQYWTKEIPARIRLEHLDLAALDGLKESTGQTLLPDVTGELDPTKLPPLDARASKVIRGGQVLRDVALRAQPDLSGLNITTIGFAYQSMQLVGQGYWRLRDPQGVNPQLSGDQVSRLNLVLQSDDFGQGLEYIGVNDVLSEGQGSIEAQLTWPGPVYKPELAQLDGSVKLLIERGNIVPLEPGAGRMVGLFALQSLPRRLDLDFKDMTADGLAFKTITGNVSIDNGVADVELVQLTGPIGVVDVTGKSDLNRREFDQRITVLPRVSAALPIIGVVSGGATAGIGALVATGLLKAMGIDLDRIGLVEYSLTGTWESPEFKTLTNGFRTER